MKTDIPLTGAQRQQRLRKRQSLLNQAMEAHGYVPSVIYLSKEHMDGLTMLEGALGGQLTPGKLSAHVWTALKQYLERSADLLTNEGFGAELKRLVAGEKWPRYTLHEVAEMNARLAIHRWEEGLHAVDSVTEGQANG